MCPVERKKIEDLAKEADIREDDISNIVDLEMRMKMVPDETASVLNEMLVIAFFFDCANCGI